LNESILKVPPHNLEAEQAVLGGCFLSKEAVNEITFLSSDDFYFSSNGLIFDAIIDLTTSGENADIVAVAERLENRHQLEDAGGMKALSVLAESTPSAANIKAYADIVYNRSLLRELLRANQASNDLVFNPEGKSAAEILDITASKIYGLTDEKVESNIKGVKELTNAWLEKVDYRFNHPGEISGLRTGFHDLDQKLNGLEGGDLVIVAGRPSMGKTALALNISDELTINQGKSVAFFSLEMPGDQLVQRSASGIGKVLYSNLKTGRIRDDEWPRITKAAGSISESKLFIDDTGGLSAMQIRSSARKIQRKHGLDAIIIDYLQLMSHPKADRQDLRIGETTKQLKNIAKELRIPVILLSQLNRGLEQREDKRPRMSDLRDSGAIEQDADIIMFVYRDEVYNEESPDKGTADIIISKQRNGSIGSVKLVFQGQFMKFENYLSEGDRYA
jgi:replicative DNA helicase